MYWIKYPAEDGALVIAKNSRSARGVEFHQLGCSFDDIYARKLMRVPTEVVHTPALAGSRGPPDNKPWPNYASESVLRKLGAQFREIDKTNEMLLADVVFEVSGFGYEPIRTVGDLHRRETGQFLKQAGLPLDLRSYNRSHGHSVLALLGNCLVRLHEIEDLIAESFIFAIDDRYTRRSLTLEELRQLRKMRTLGSLVNEILRVSSPDPQAAGLLRRFVDDRNLLIHGITTQPRYSIDTAWGRLELQAFIVDFEFLLDFAEMVFRSSLSASLQFASDVFELTDLQRAELRDLVHVEDLSGFTEIFFRDG